MMASDNAGKREANTSAGRAGPVVQSPVNDPNAPSPSQVDEDNAQSRAMDEEKEDRDRETDQADPVKRAVSGTNAQGDNLAAQDAARTRRKGPRPTGFNPEVTPQDPDDPTPAKLDSFGRQGDVHAPRPTMTPDLAEPLNNPAGRGPQAVEAGDATARLHAGMRATGARNYGILDDQSEGEDPQGSDPNPPGELGTIRDPGHALPLLRTRASNLHRLVHNIGGVDNAPTNEIESLLAEMQYLTSVIRRAT